MIVKKKVITNSNYTFLYIMLFLSFMHAIFRTNEESSISPYILLVPICYVYILKKTFRQYSVVYVIFVLLLIYNLVLTLFYNNVYNEYVGMAIHYVFLFLIFIVIKFLIDNGKFVQLFRLYKFYFYFSSITLICEIVFGFRMPNTSVSGIAAGFSWNCNEYSVGVAAFLPIYILFERNSIKKIFIIFLSLFLMYLVDSKITLFGSILGILLYLMKSIHYLRYVAIIMIPCLFLIPWQDMEIEFDGGNVFSLTELLFEPIQAIFHGETFYDTGGSIITRANAIIYAMTEWKESYFIGIGCGNTLFMMQKPQFYLKAAESIHNLPVQLLVENGITILIFYCFYLGKFFHSLFVKLTTEKDLLILLTVGCVFIGSMGSSVGIFSNYFFFANLFLSLVLYFDTKTALLKKILE